MRPGRVLQQGSPEALYRSPIDEYVARFFGETNILSQRASTGGFETALGLVSAPRVRRPAAPSASACARNTWSSLQGRVLGAPPWFSGCVTPAPGGVFS